MQFTYAGLNFPMRYDEPPHRAKPVPYVEDEIQRGPAKSLLNWGAHQVKWRYPRADVYPNSSRYPVEPNFEGLAKYQTKDEVAVTWTTPPTGPYQLPDDFRSAPAYWSMQKY